VPFAVCRNPSMILRCPPSDVLSTSTAT